MSAAYLLLRLVWAALADGAPRIAFIGAGNYATGVLIPAFKAAGASLQSVATRGGVTALHAGRKFGFREAASDADAVLADDNVDAVVITTRHDSHARFVLKALEAGKHVFVEKPLCLTLDELVEIENAYADLADIGDAPLLMVGFNRRFAPHVVKMKELLSGMNVPKAFVMTVNAGVIPIDHWTQDAQIGGGRIIGEACHFVNLLRYLSGAPINHYSILAMDSSTKDTFSICFGFEDGLDRYYQLFCQWHKKFSQRET